MANQSSRGPEVPPSEDLFRGIVRPEWWDPDDKHLSSGVFGFPKFSAYIASMTRPDAVLRRFPDGTGLIIFNCGAARGLGFDPRHEPEGGDESHANVYCDLSSNSRKRQARKLVDASRIIQEPDLDKLQGRG